MNNTFQEPTNFGWINHQMDDNTVKHIWDCINTARGDNYKGTLVGQIDKSYSLKDKNDRLWKTVLAPLYQEYGNKWGHRHARVPLKLNMTAYLEDMWVNYQNQHEYNPTHDHGGIYSFAAWLKIPTWYEDQAKIGNAAGASTSYNGTFNFQYLDIFGNHRTVRYDLTPEYENTLLFFPSCLQHCVYPYYNCDEQRISISGNIWLKWKR